MFDLQDQALLAGSLLHGTLTGVGAVVAGTHTLPSVALVTHLLARGAATPAALCVPQTLPSTAARDVHARPGIFREKNNSVKSLLRTLHVFHFNCILPFSAHINGCEKISGDLQEALYAMKSYKHGLFQDVYPCLRNTIALL